MKLVMLFVELFNVFFYLVLISSKAVTEISCSSCISARLVSFLFLFLFLSVIQFVNSRCYSLMLNHHSITKLIISLTLTLLQCYFFNTPSVDYINTGSVDLTLGVYCVPSVQLKQYHGQGRRYGFWAPWTAYSLGRGFIYYRNRDCFPEPVFFSLLPNQIILFQLLKSFSFVCNGKVIIFRFGFL